MTHQPIDELMDTCQRQEAKLKAITAETMAELERIEQHGGELGFALRIQAILEGK